MSKLTALCLLFVVAVVTYAKIPDQYFGRWELGESENYDEYLAAKGYSWMLRWVISRSSCIRVFTPRADGTFQLLIETPKSKIVWDNIQLGQEFQTEYLDESKRIIRFDYVNDEKDGARLIEMHRKRDGTKEAFEYRIGTDGNMVMIMKEKNIVAKRFYKKLANDATKSQ